MYEFHSTVISAVLLRCLLKLEIQDTNKSYILFFLLFLDQ